MLTRLLKLGNMYFHQQVDANEPGIKIIDWFTIRPLHHSFGIEDNWVFHLVEQTTVVFTGLNRPVRKPSVPNTCYNGSLYLSPSKANRSHEAATRIPPFYRWNQLFPKMGFRVTYSTMCYDVPRVSCQQATCVETPVCVQVNNLKRDGVVERHLEMAQPTKKTM